MVGIRLDHTALVTCWVRKSRASGAPGVRFQAVVLEHDALGCWFLIEPLTPHIHDDGGWVVAVLPVPVLGLAPYRGNWVASTSHVDAKVDLCRRVSISTDDIAFEDVELDVVWRWGEPARIVDLDDFEALALPPHEVARYLAEADAVRVAAEQRRVFRSPT